MTGFPTNPRVLILTPEVTYLPEGMGDSHCINARAGGLADVSAALICELYKQGADVHVALPDYRSIFNGHSSSHVTREVNTIGESVPSERIHLAQDRAFFYRDYIYSGCEFENIKISLAFQREVINNIVPRVQPDLIHCNDWMTGLIPAMARQLDIPCLFTIHNIHTAKSLLAEIEDTGIDGASFWHNLFFESFPSNYENTRDSIPINFLTSGAFAAHFVNTVSPTFLKEIIQGRHGFAKNPMQRELSNKSNAGCAVGILNSPDPSFSPELDDALICKYSAKNHVLGKKKNKRFLQKTLGLIQDTQAPVFFWPSPLDPVQKGCQLMAEILYKVVSCYWKQNLEIVFIADGEFQRHFKEIVRFHNLSDRIAVCGFDDRLARSAYAASDFVLMPSSFEPCGLPQMIGPIYGALPVAHDTGGIHDTVDHLDIDRNTGNGFLFKAFGKESLSWAIDQAMDFYNSPIKEKKQQIKRIMRQSTCRFNHKITAQNYIDLYEKMLQRPLINPENVESSEMNKNSVKKETSVQHIADMLTDTTEMAEQPFSENSDKQNIINLSEREWGAEEQQSKLLRVNQ